VSEAAPIPPPAPSTPPASEPAKPSPVPGRRADKAPRAAVVDTPAATPPATATPPSPAPSPIPETKPAPEAKPAPPPAPRRVTIPAGTVLAVRTRNTLSTERNYKDDTFTATLDEPLTVDGLVIAEKGAEVEGRVARSERGGRVEGLASLAVELVQLHASDGQKVSIATNLVETRAESSRRSDAKKVGIATGVGAIIGAIAGGGKGAAIGAGVGAGAGAGAVIATRGDHAVISSESRLDFRLQTPVEVTERQ